MERRFFRFTYMLLTLTLLIPAESRPALAQALIPLRLQLVEVDPTKLPVLIAMEQGIFKKNGLDVDLYISPAAREISMRRDLYLPPEFQRTDPAQISFGGGFGIAKISYTAGYTQSRVILATLDPLVHWKVIGIPEIKTPEDLKGRRLDDGNLGDENHVIARLIMQKMHWDPLFDVSLLEASPDLYTLRRGLVDALIASELTLAGATTAGLGYHVIMETAPWKIPIPGSGINVTREWLRDNRDTATRFLKSLVEGIAVMKKDRNAANRAMAKWFNITNPEHQKIFYDGTADMERKPYPSVEGIKTIMKLYDSREMRKHQPEEFYDDSVMREIDGSGFIDGLYR